MWFFDTLDSQPSESFARSESAKDPLLEAVHNGNVEKTKLLVRRGYDVKKGLLASLNYMPYRGHVSEGNLQVAMFLFTEADNSMKYNTIIRLSYMAPQSTLMNFCIAAVDTQNALSYIIRKGDHVLAALKLLEGESEYTIHLTLNAAVRYNRSRLCSAILDTRGHVLDSEMLDHAFNLACRRGFRDIIKLFTKRNIRTNVRYDSFIQACAEGHIHAIKLFVHSCSDEWLEDGSLEASRRGFNELAKFLDKYLMRTRED